MRVHRIFAELLGTLILSFSVTQSEGSPVSMGAGLWCSIIATGFISGGHFNPAITTSVLLVKGIYREVTLPELLQHMAYFLCHFLGGMLGAMLSWAVKGDTWKLMISEEYSLSSGFLAEMCGTTILVLVAQVQGVMKDTAFVGTLAVAATYYLGGLTLRSISGGCLNPALGVGVNFADAVNYGGDRASHMWIYICGPFTGALLSAVLFIIMKPELDKVHKLKKQKRSK
jgi:glycerol uptake facilitator-like aquaporin